MAKKPVHVFLFGGKYGALYSAGLRDEYVPALQKTSGVTASYHDYGYWPMLTGFENHHTPKVAEKIKQGYRVVLAGHSMGATAVSQILRDLLARGIKAGVELAFGLDPSRWSPPFAIDTRSVVKSICFYDDAHFIGGAPFKRIEGQKWSGGNWLVQDTAGVPHIEFDNDRNFRSRLCGEVTIIANKEK